jgi:hypothetical protein
VNRRLIEEEVRREFEAKGDLADAPAHARAAADAVRGVWSLAAGV